MVKENQLSAYCVYTILHTEKLEKAYRRGGKGQEKEQQTWKSGHKLLGDARLSGERLPVVFGRAEGEVVELVYCALLDEITLGHETTLYRFSQLTPIEPAQPITRLTLKMQKRPLSADFIRPYALCLTPPFVRELLEDTGVRHDSSDSAERS